MKQIILIASLIFLCVPIFCQEYSPEITFDIEPPFQDQVSSLSLTVDQEPGEMDTQQFQITAGSGTLMFDGLLQNDIIGDGLAYFMDGQCDEAFAQGEGGYGPDYTCPESLMTELMVLLTIFEFIPQENRIAAVLTITHSNNPEYPIGFSPAGVILQNLSMDELPEGFEVEVAYLQPDPGNITQGYQSVLTLNDMLLSPAEDHLDFITQFTPETGSILLDQQTIPLFIGGCTDPLAFNFDPVAEMDDGSCQETLPGDLTGEMAIDVLDVVLMVNIILGYSPGTPYQYAAGDINQDGALTVLDVVLLVSIILAP